MHNLFSRQLCRSRRQDDHHGIDSKDQPVSDEIIGWYYGEPREDLLRKYGNGNIKANYMDDGGYSHTPAEEDNRQKAAREFKEYLESLEEAAALYEEDFVVGFKGRFVQLFFDAINFNAICSALDDQE